jgi:hypothetical protein
VLALTEGIHGLIAWDYQEYAAYIKKWTNVRFDQFAAITLCPIAQKASASLEAFYYLLFNARLAGYFAEGFDLPKRRLPQWSGYQQSVRKHQQEVRPSSTRSSVPNRGRPC